MNRKPKILHLPLWNQGRTICISDIHGNLDIYKKLLKICQYDSQNDRLILLGDLLEKGPKNLETLRYIMNQYENGHVYCLMGNCDFTVKNAFLSYRLGFLKHILELRQRSVLHEMAHEIGLSFDQDIDMEIYCQTLRKHFYKEMAFCNDLPHIIETEDMILTHAGLESEKDYGDDFRIPMTMPFFMNRDVSFKKKVICGHMPVTEYQRYIAHFDPVYNASKNIYSIDGGNIVKKAGQLNALIFKGNYVEIKRTDGLEEGIVIEEVPYQNQIPLWVTWNHGQVKIQKMEDNQAYVYCPYLHRSFWVEKEFLQKRNDEWYATDYTNYQIPLKKGDHVKIVSSYQDKVQIKKDGVIGWAFQSQIKRSKF